MRSPSWKQRGLVLEVKQVAAPSIHERVYVSAARETVYEWEPGSGDYEGTCPRPGDFTVGSHAGPVRAHRAHPRAIPGRVDRIRSRGPVDDRPRPAHGGRRRRPGRLRRPHTRMHRLPAQRAGERTHSRAGPRASGPGLRRGRRPDGRREARARRVRGRHRDRRDVRSGPDSLIDPRTRPAPATRSAVRSRQPSPRAAAPWKRHRWPCEPEPTWSSTPAPSQLSTDYRRKPGPGQ